MTPGAVFDGSWRGRNKRAMAFRSPPTGFYQIVEVPWRGWWSDMYKIGIIGVNSADYTVKRL